MAEPIRGAEFSDQIYPIFKDSTEIKEAVATEELLKARSVDRNFKEEDSQQPDGVFYSSAHTVEITLGVFAS